MVVVVVVVGGGGEEGTVQIFVLIVLCTGFVGRMELLPSFIEENGEHWSTGDVSRALQDYLICIGRSAGCTSCLTI